jgi:Tfp pilus assembly protein PilE
MRRRQRGMTFIGLMIIMSMLGVIVYAGVRLVPIYLTYMKVSKSLDATAGEFKGDTVDPAALRRTLEKHWQIEDINGVDVKDVEVTKNDSGTQMHVAYDDSAPYIANVSLTVHFDKTVTVR